MGDADDGRGIRRIEAMGRKAREEKDEGANLKEAIKQGEKHLTRLNRPTEQGEPRTEGRLTENNRIPAINIVKDSAEISTCETRGRER